MSFNDINKNKILVDLDIFKNFVIDYFDYKNTRFNEFIKEIYFILDNDIYEERTKKIVLKKIKLFRKEFHI